MRLLLMVVVLASSCSSSPEATSTLSTATTTTAPLKTSATDPSALPKALAVHADELVLVGAGDIATCDGPGDSATGKQVQRILDASANAWAFTTGDNVYPGGTMEEFRRCYEPAWGAFKQRTLATVGNHDYHTPNAAGFRDTFAGRFSQDGPLWYAQDVSGVDLDGQPVSWRVVVLDSNCDLIGCGPTSKQATWLRAELLHQKLVGQQCSVVLFHHPRFSSGPHGDATFMAPMWNELAAAGVDLVLAGHDHIYERFSAMTGDGTLDAVKGMPSITIGTGGKSHYPAPFARQHSLALSSDDDGVLVLRLTSRGYTAAMWSTDDEIADVHSGRCR